MAIFRRRGRTNVVTEDERNVKMRKGKSYADTERKAENRNVDSINQRNKNKGVGKESKIERVKQKKKKEKEKRKERKEERKKKKKRSVNFPFLP